jgi:hypothetical protein
LARALQYYEAGPRSHQKNQEEIKMKREIKRDSQGRFMSKKICQNCGDEFWAGDEFRDDKYCSQCDLGAEWAEEEATEHEKYRQQVRPENYDPKIHG